MTRSLVQRAARRYVAGPELDDALAVAHALHQRQVACTLGYWDDGAEPPDRVRRQAVAAAAALADSGLDAYLSIKAPALGYDLGELPHAGTRVHLDALQHDSAGRHLGLAQQHGVGLTLPGRWRRSQQDALSASGLRVRVVKGQFPAPGAEVEPRAGFLAVVDALLGRAAFVAVATHDAALAAEALRRLRAAGTPCGLELLHGLRAPAGSWTEGVPVRVYIPYGKAYLPYAVRALLSHPQTMGWLARDLLTGFRPRPSLAAPASGR